MNAFQLFSNVHRSNFQTMRRVHDRTFSTSSYIGGAAAYIDGIDGAEPYIAIGVGIDGAEPYIDDCRPSGTKGGPAIGAIAPYSDVRELTSTNECISPGVARIDIVDIGVRCEPACSPVLDSLLLLLLLFLRRRHTKTATTAATMSTATAHAAAIRAISVVPSNGVGSERVLHWNVHIRILWRFAHSLLSDDVLGPHGRQRAKSAHGGRLQARRGGPRGGRRRAERSDCCQWSIVDQVVHGTAVGGGWNSAARRCARRRRDERARRAENGGNRRCSIFAADCANSTVCTRRR
jgi:hypothetical protein